MLVLTIQLYDVEDDNGNSDDDGLSGLNAVDASHDVDGICTEDSQHAHVDVV